MLSAFWLGVVGFLLAVYFLQAFRRLVLFVLGWVLGHAWLLWRRLTRNSARRVEKRAYLEQNPLWREYARMTPRQQEEARRREELARRTEAKGKTTTTTTIATPTTSSARASPPGARTSPGVFSSPVTPTSHAASPPPSMSADSWTTTGGSRKLSHSTDALPHGTSSAAPSRKHSGATPREGGGGGSGVAWNLFGSANPSKKKAVDTPPPVYTFNGHVVRG